MRSALVALLLVAGAACGATPEPPRTASSVCQEAQDARGDVSNMTPDELRQHSEYIRMLDDECAARRIAEARTRESHTRQYHSK